MHSQIYSGLSLIFAILRNFRVAGANGFISISWANIVFFIESVKKSHFRTSFKVIKRRKSCMCYKKVIRCQGNYMHSVVFSSRCRNTFNAWSRCSGLLMTGNMCMPTV